MCAGPFFRCDKLCFNKLHSGPEMACQDLRRHVDGCAHDMWGAGCLMYQAFTGSQPWHVGSLGPNSDDKQWASLYRQHQTWVCVSSILQAPRSLVVLSSQVACTGVPAQQKQQFTITNHLLDSSCQLHCSFLHALSSAIHAVMPTSLWSGVFFC